jgi:hypothetical protein
VEDAAQMDGMIRFCRRHPQCIAGYEVSAELSRNALQMLGPAIHLRFVPASRLQPLAAADDVVRIAAAAALPEPLSLQFRQDNGTDNCFVRYIVPGQCEALIGYCNANPVYRRDGVSWRLYCKYVE